MNEYLNLELLRNWRWSSKSFLKNSACTPACTLNHVLSAFEAALVVLLICRKKDSCSRKSIISPQSSGFFIKKKNKRNRKITPQIIARVLNWCSLNIRNLCMVLFITMFHNYVSRHTKYCVIKYFRVKRKGDGHLIIAIFTTLVLSSLIHLRYGKKSMPLLSYLFDKSPKCIW